MFSVIAFYSHRKPEGGENKIDNRVKVIHILSDTNIGGGGIFLKTLVSGGFDKNKFDMEVMLPPNSLLAPLLADCPIKLTELKSMADKSLDIRAVSELRRLFKDKKPDIINTYAAMSARIAGRFASTKIKIVYTRLTVSKPPYLLTVFPFKYINRVVNNIFADSIISVSPAATDNLTAAGVNKNNIRLIYNGVDKPNVLNEAEKAAVRERYGIGQDKFIAALIGRLSPEKGHSTVIEAARLLINDKDIVFIFTGTGPLEGELRRDKPDNIIMPGFVKDISQIQNIMDLQINASLMEATSLSLLEGMSLCKPAIASDSGGNPYVIKDGVNGLMFKTNDGGALAEAIQRIKSDRELYKNLSANAGRVYNERFTSKEMINSICGLYEEVLHGQKF